MDRLNEGTDAGEILRMMKALTLTTLLAFLIPQAYVQAEPVIEPQPKYEITYLEPLEAPELAKVEQAVQVAVPKPKPQQTAPKMVGCEMVRAAIASKGFSGAELDAAVELARLESGCNSLAVNKSSGACNLFQEYRCGKWGGLHNLDAHINGAIGYMQSSYGSWQNALYKWHTRSPHWW